MSEILLKVKLIVEKRSIEIKVTDNCTLKDVKDMIVQFENYNNPNSCIVDYDTALLFDEAKTVKEMNLHNGDCVVII